MKHIKIIVSLFTFVLILTIPKVYAEELDWCEMSDEYKEWLNSDNKEELIEPAYCKSDNDSYEQVVMTIDSLFDITSSVSDVYYSSVDSGFVTTAKNQNNNNACWAFTSVSLLETQALKKGILAYDKADFSEAHIFYNTSRFSFYDVNTNTYNRTLNDGGSPSVAASYFYGGIGPVYESDFPYSGEETYTQKSFVDNYTGKPVLDVDSFIFEMHKNESDKCSDYIPIIKQKIVDYGSTGINLNFEVDDLKQVGSNYYYSYSGDLLSANHSVTIVGWDDRIPASYFGNSKVTSNGAWIVKNSWGTGFGVNGFFYVSYYDPITCREIYNFTSNKKYSYDNNYAGSDAYGNIMFTKNDNGAIYLSSTFDDVGDEKLYKVSFQVSDNTSYTAYLSTDNNLSSPENWIELGSIQSTERGIKSIYVDGIAVSDAFTIIVKNQSINENKTSIYTMCSSTNDSSFYYDMSISTGRNYYFLMSSEGTPTGFTDLGYMNQTLSGETFNGCENIIYAYTKDEGVISSNSDNVVVEDNKIQVNLRSAKELTAQTLTDNLNVSGSIQIYTSSGQSVGDMNTKLGTGSRIVVNNKYEFTVIVNGDVSGDGVIKSNDALMISRYLVGLTQLSDIQSSAADVHKNGIIKSNDALIISQFLVGMRESL